jgi:hypothetical protein
VKRINWAWDHFFPNREREQKLMFVAAAVVGPVWRRVAADSSDRLAVS